MASKAYVASMTVTELKQELKQRGLSTRGSKKSLRDRLERAFDEEELDDPSSESESGQLGPTEASFNFNVPAESFLPPDQIREDSPVPSPNREKMIISVELSNKETLEVYSPQPPPVRDEVGGEAGDKSGPLVVAVSLPNDAAVVDGMEATENHNSLPTVATVMVEPEAPAEESFSHTSSSVLLEVKGTIIEPKSAIPGDMEVPVTSLSADAVLAEDNRVEPTPAAAEVDEADKADKEGEISEEGGGGGTVKGAAAAEVVSADSHVEVNKQVEPEIGEGQVEGKTSPDVVVGVDEPSPHGPKEDTAVEDMEVDLSEPLQSLPIPTEEGGPIDNISKIEEREGQIEGEGEGEVTLTDDKGVEGGMEGTEQVVEEREKSPIEGQVTSSDSIANEGSEEMETKEDAGWLIVEKPEEQSSKDMEGPCEGGSDGSGEVKGPSGEKDQEGGKGQAQQTPDEEEQKEEEQKNEGTVDMEIAESSNNETAAIRTGQDQSEPHMETEKTGHEEKREEPPMPPAAAQDDCHPTPEERQVPEDSALPVLSSSTLTSTEKDGTVADKPPVPTEAAVSEEVSTESGQIEVAVLVHAEEDDLSVFSTEAAEAQKIASSREKERGKPRDKVRDRDRDRDKSKHRRASTTSAASLSSSKQQSPHIDEGAGSNASSKSGSVVGRTSPSEETRHDGEENDNRVEPLKKRRRISAHVSSATDPPSIQWGGEKRRRWGSGKQRSTSSTTNISSDVLKDIIPSELEMAEGEGEVVMEGGGEGETGEEIHMEGEAVNGEQDKMPEKEKDEHQLEWERKVKEKEAKQREAERARQELETRQRIEARIRARQEVDAKSRKKQEEEKEPGKKRSPSPARNPTSHILHVENMTRPFTLGQLRDLLMQDGPLLKDGFWTNNVKSHCIGVYASKEVAAITRHRLHGLKWPSTNPKLLAVDFLSPEQVQKISEGDLVVMEAPPEAETKEGGVEKEAEGKVEGEGEAGSGDVVKEEKVEGGEGKSEEEGRKKRRESEQEKQEKVEKAKDINKDTKKDEASKTARPPTEPAAVQEKSSPATRLLDDLFRKTKATPSVYWLPLSEAEVQQKQLEQEAREAEREKRRQERQKAYEEERRKEREKEEMAKKERERRIQEERDRRARERVNRRSRDYSRSRSRSRDCHRDRDRSRR